MRKHSQNATLLWKGQYIERDPNFNCISVIAKGNDEILVVNAFSNRTVVSIFVPESTWTHPSCISGNCNICGIAQYWNYSKCASCHIGCKECQNDFTCLECFSMYSITPDKRCKLRGCNCSSIILPTECSKLCNLSNSIEHSNSTMNKCEKNNSACNIANYKSCPPLCELCINEQNRTHCTKCKRFQNIIQHGIDKDYVDCKCKFEYELKDGYCVPIKKMQDSKNSESISLAYIMSALFAVVLFMIGIMWIIKKKCSQTDDLHKNANTSTTKENIRNTPANAVESVITNSVSN